MTVQSAFPDFDLSTLPAIPANWTDVSWRNDTCPSFEAVSYPAFNVYVFVDFADTGMREHEGGSRFNVIKVAANNGDTETLLESDDWQAVISFAESL